jgi:3',5'-cyclic AMP phosphodiesterase CpdA
MIIAQLTDLHVRADGLCCHGIADSMSNLTIAVSHINSLEPRPDVALISGDLSDDGYMESYRKVKECLDGLHMPYFVIPGNHDDGTNLKQAFADHPYLPDAGDSLHYVIEDFPLRLIGLDTTVPKEVGGRMCALRRQWLSERLQERKEQPTLLFMHHPPLMTGISGLDQYPLAGMDELEALISDHLQVELIICGHVHRAITRKFGGTIVLTSPSTSYQFTCDLSEDATLTAILEPAAYLIHTWSPDGGMLTHSPFIDDYEGPFPLAG